jgi:hypothetical protein
MKYISVSISQIILLAVMLPLLGHAGSTQSADSDFWQQQYQEMQQKIVENQSLKKTTVDRTDVLDSNALILSTDRTPIDVLTRRTKALLKSLKSGNNTSKIAELEQKLNALQSENRSKGLSKLAASATTDDQDLFIKISALNKEAALSNPLVDFDSLVFVGYVMPKSGTEAHICDQYNAWNLGTGGGLYIVKGIKSGSTTLIDVLKNSSCVNGSFKGSNLAGGAFGSLDLSYDGKTILFSWSPSSNPCSHIFKVNIDGSNLTQLTDGSATKTNFLTDSNHNDFNPVWLPNGRIVFISDRRGGYGRCHTNYKQTFTLHSMKDDGSDIVCLSYHETNEWHPSVDNRGKIVYTRWDYVDRDDCIAHHMWECYPDGRDPRSYHGNYPLPLNTLNGTGTDGRFNRPVGEFNIRAIPNSSKYIAIAGCHHQFTFGEVIMLDPHNVEDDGKVSQVKRITTYWNNWPDFAIGPYGTPWPLSEDYYICSKSGSDPKANGGSLILRDKSGGEQVIYTSSGSWRPLYPIPVKPREMPSPPTTGTWQGERKTLTDHYRATIKINNVTNGDMALPANTIVKALRIVQVFPKETMEKNKPQIGYPLESLARMSLGTVPVEADGSVYCEAPVGKTIYFQLIDDKGLAVASMRSATYVHEGEQMLCDGCHENKWKVTPSGEHSAFKRAPSKLTADAGGVEPVNFARLVKPAFDKNCTSCHTQKGKGPNMSFSSLKNYAFFYCLESTSYPGYLNGDIVTAVKGGSRSVPGKLGASYSKLINYINGTHNSAKLTDDEYKRVTLWLDLNSNELGADYNESQQRSGQLVWPRIDVNSANPQGIENDYPVFGVSNVLNQKQNEQIRIYRNGSVILFNHPEIAMSSASIFDLSGRRIYQWHFDKETTSFNFDMKKYSLAKGTYILSTSTLNQKGIKSGNDMSTKFVIQ